MNLPKSNVKDHCARIVDLKDQFCVFLIFLEHSWEYIHAHVPSTKAILESFYDLAIWSVDSDVGD